MIDRNLIKIEQLTPEMKQVVELNKKIESLNFSEDEKLVLHLFILPKEKELINELLKVKDNAIEFKRILNDLLNKELRKMVTHLLEKYKSEPNDTLRYIEYYSLHKGIRDELVKFLYLWLTEDRNVFYRKFTYFVNFLLNQKI